VASDLVVTSLPPPNSDDLLQRSTTDGLSAAVAAKRFVDERYSTDGALGVTLPGVDHWIEPCTRSLLPSTTPSSDGMGR